MHKVDNAVIMAAGTSSRFAPLSYKMPKALITVKGEVLIERQINQLLEAGINDIYIVTGYKSEMFDYLEEKFSVKLIHNPDFLTRNNNASMCQITKITDDKTNTFTSIYNYATHEPMILQVPEYLPTATVDNTEYDAKMGYTRTVNGKTLLLEDEVQIKHYQVNIAALLRVGTWLDYLRDNDVYDNTRIIIVADHGRDLKQIKELQYSDKIDIAAYYPLFMVKDFGSTEFTTSNEFMTTADVATIATNGLIENPVNPFTKNPINSDPKKQEKHFIFKSDYWDITTNNGDRFDKDDWMSVEDNIWDLNGWKHYNISTDNPNDIPDYPGQIFNNKNPVTQN